MKVHARTSFNIVSVLSLRYCLFIYACNMEVVQYMIQVSRDVNLGII